MAAPERWAYVASGEIRHGPGPIPYVWNTPFGDPIQLHGLTDIQKDQLGWKRVEQRNWREIDEEIEVRLTPIVFVENGLPVEEYDYEFTPGARVAMLRKIDEQAEAIRKQFITSAPGQAMEYEEAARQATAAMAAPDPLDPEDYPFLAADVGNTLNPLTLQPVASVREAAEVIAYTRAAWHTVGAEIRARRLGTKMRIRAAATVEDAYDEYLSAWEGL